MGEAETDKGAAPGVAPLSVSASPMVLSACPSVSGA